MNMIQPQATAQTLRVSESDMLAAGTCAVGFKHMDHEDEDREMQDTEITVQDDQYEIHTSAREG